MINLNKGWHFFNENLSPKDETEGWGGAKSHAYSYGAAAESLDDSKWRIIDLPHDFVVEGDYTRRKVQDDSITEIPEMESIDSRLFAGGSLSGGIAWYRRTFELDETDSKRVYLYFGGVFRNCTVYLNEYYIGHHKSGYTSFYFDITDFVNMRGKNTLAVRVDAVGREGWWYEGGGIYRDVWLEVQNNVHIAPWGNFVYSDTDPEKKAARTFIETELINKELVGKTVVVENIIYSREGKKLQSHQQK